MHVAELWQAMNLAIPTNTTSTMTLVNLAFWVHAISACVALALCQKVHVNRSFRVAFISIKCTLHLWNIVGFFSFSAVLHFLSDLTSFWGLLGHVHDTLLLLFVPFRLPLRSRLTVSSARTPRYRGPSLSKTPTRYDCMINWMKLPY